MKYRHSILFKMITVFLIVLIFPAFIVVIYIPYYYNSSMVRNTDNLFGTVMDMTAKNINTYVMDLERLAVVPYMNDSIMRAFYTLKETNQGEDIPMSERLNAKRVLEQTFPNYMQNARQDITGTLVCFDGKNAFSVYKDNRSLVSNYDFAAQDWYQRAYKADGKTVFISSHQQDYLIGKDSESIFSVVKLIKDLDTKQPIAVVKADASTKILSSILDGVKLPVTSIIVVSDNHGNIICTNHPLSDGIRLGIAKNQTIIDIDRDIYSVISQPIERTEWKVMMIVSQTEYRQHTQWMQWNVILLYTLASVISIFFYVYFSNRITKPLRAMVDVMAKVEKGDFTARVKVKKHDEIASLGNAFNLMTQQLNQLINQEYKAIIAEQKAEYHALQSQIEPHFLYNTLNSLIGMNRMHDHDLLEKAILSLTGMLRYVTEQADSTTIQAELLMIEQYCCLQKFRFQNRFDYKIEMQKDVIGKIIPKLLIQPLVENAIIHGIEPSDKPCRLLVKVTEQIVESQKRLIIIVEDNGIGFDTGCIRDSTHVGLCNVLNRLKYFCPDALANVKSQPGVGTTITMVIPMEGKDD